jgi:hypothetical protein
MCHKTMSVSRSRPYVYNIFIKYQGMEYEIPYLKPEDYGALKQVLKKHGKDIEQCP